MDNPEPNIKNVFVLMLENHSFDNIFAMSGIQDINVATVHDCNSYHGEKYLVRDGAPAFMTTDPGHEFKDVLEQLCGADAACKYKGGTYPSVNNSGFASSYATSISEGTGTPTPEHIGDISDWTTGRRCSIRSRLLTASASICISLRPCSLRLPLKSNLRSGSSSKSRA